MNFIKSGLSFIESKEFLVLGLQMYSGYYFSNYVVNFLDLPEPTNSGMNVAAANTAFVRFLSYKTGMIITGCTAKLSEQAYTYLMEYLYVEN